MDNFTQILLKLPTMMKAPFLGNHFIGTTSLKVQVNFGILLLEKKIDANDLEKWLSLLEFYNCVQHFPTVRRSPSRSLSPFPMSNIGGTLTMCNIPKMNLKHLGQNPLKQLFFMPSRRNSYMLETTMTNT
jgi:hypothetical protein